ncbi:MAG: acyltransferase [Ferruginibacter sp.]
MAVKGKIGIVETIRGLAALAVCLFHFSKCNLIFEGSTKYFFTIASYGWAGVEAFFVVSGFIIPYSLAKANYRISQFFQFFARRCIRIEPAYLASILIVVLLGYLVQKVPGFMGSQSNVSVQNILLHLGYLPEHFGYNWLLPVYWSLEAEFHYYILIGLGFVFIWKNTLNLFIGITLGLISSFFIPLYVFSFMPFFIMGIITCAKRSGKVNAYVFYLVLLIAFSVCIVRGLGSFTAIVGFATALLIANFEWRTRMTDFLGKISFSLYLMHVPVGGKVLNYLGRYANNEWKVWGALIIALAITIIASWIFYKLIEYPSQMLSKRIQYNRNEKSTDRIASLSAG